jgi:hypothetical protein
MARTYTKKELRKAYQVSDKTFNIWLKRIPNFLPQVGAHVFSPLEVEDFQGSIYSTLHTFVFSKESSGLSK